MYEGKYDVLHEKVTGTIKMVKISGYGYIVLDMPIEINNKRADVFFHASDIKNDLFENISNGQKVVIDMVVKNLIGLHAIGVEVLKKTSKKKYGTKA